MNPAASPTFRGLDELPTEVRDMIFGYMIENTIESHYQPIRHDLPWWTRNDSHTEGLDTINAKEYLSTSPFVKFDRQYCAEYLEIFVRNVELRAYFDRQWAGGCSGLVGRREPIKLEDARRGSKGVAALKDSLQLISDRFDNAIPHAGFEGPSKTLLSQVKGICLSYHFKGSIFETGFYQPENRTFPPEDYLRRPMKLLRRYHEEYEIPCDRLSIHISYGNPSGAVLACQKFLARSPISVSSLTPVQAHIRMDNYRGSVVAIDRSLKATRKAVKKIIGKMRKDNPKWDEVVLHLKQMFEEDMTYLRRRHLKAIGEVTKFWKAQDGWYDLDDMFRIAEAWGSE
jgi:hypothetical protein